MGESYISMVCHSYYPWDPRVRREAESLTEDGYTVEIICLRNDGEASVECVNGIMVYRLPAKRHQGSSLFIYLVEYLMFFAMSSFILTRQYFRKRYKLIHVHNLPDFLVFVASVPKIFGASVLLDIHDVMPEFFASKHDLDKDSYLIKFVGWVETMSARFADHILTAMPAFKEAIASSGANTFECSEHNGHHLFVQRVIMELVSEVDQPVAIGQAGDVILTDLFNYSMPFIRYRVGDVGVFCDQMCPCGRGLPLVKSLRGKITDMIKFGNGMTLSGPGLVMVFKEFPIRQYQIVQLDPHSLLVRIIKGNEYTDQDTSRIVKTMDIMWVEG